MKKLLELEPPTEQPDLYRLALDVKLLEDIKKTGAFPNYSLLYFQTKTYNKFLKKLQYLLPNSINIVKSFQWLKRWKTIIFFCHSCCLFKAVILNYDKPSYTPIVGRTV